MNIHELDSFKLSDAVKFHNRLNPKIWGKDEQLLPEVHEKLMAMAADFQQFLGVSDLQVKDITVSGSNAAYSYTPHSDIDLHVVVDFPQGNEIYQELFNAKKFQYNDEHNLAINGIPVELYVQNSAEDPVSQGEYSVLNNQWIQVPRRKRAKIDDTCVRAKVEDLDARIHNAIKSGDADAMGKLWDKIRNMRQSGLDEHGEFGCENIAFKILRTNGCIKDLRTARTAAQDREMSLREQNKPKSRKVWGFTEGHQGSSYSSEDGVAPSTQMFLNEEEPNDKAIVSAFIDWVAGRIGIESMPEIVIHDSPEWSTEHHSFGMYEPEQHRLNVSMPNRHLLDVLRTTAHELVHCRQNELSELPPDAGLTGSKWENEANAQAGIIMRDFADAHPEYFDNAPLKEASGYIPTRAQAKDPRFKMALTVDVHPGQTGKEANKMALQTDAQGKPALLMKTANLRESLAAEFEIFAEGKSYGYNSTPLSQVPGEREDELGNQEATGPEFPPQMPAGTTKIDVSDLTDWYRLGMDISDLDDAKPENYNQGPPQTVIVFPSDEAEQGYLKQFKRLGLKTHDLDPDVEGGEDLTGKHLHQELEEEFALLEQEFLGEIKMTGKNLGKLASDIKGVKVGLEFEMIVPNATVEDDGNMEPDYDRDERVRDIDDAVEFFDDGDYNGRADLRRLREAMQESYWEWKTEALDHDWYNGDGFDYFREWLEGNDPFDEEEAQEEATNELQAQYGDDITPEEFQKMLDALVEEKREAYVQEQWDNQTSNFDDARQEYDDEHRDDYSEEDWLRDQSIRYASDVESNFGHVTWPYYTSNSDDGEADIERIALEFMNESGLPYDSVAVSSSYHGTYKKWVGNGWVSVGSEKPDDCFSIEPDGSLDGNSSDDVGLEFVSPPIPLEQVGDVMSKVQRWAAANGVYTGKNNKTSMHTNISVPGYDLKNLDYLKAALLLGDEYVLRQFDRIGNTYAKPAIEKVRQLVNQRPEKAKELLDKMKSQLNAEASKLIHSGQTDKFTSINTKNNRIEFRSPGGDYLSDIADNPKKMQDTINRMVVAMDAAMDPNKYKQEYQKKLYKMLTGQTFGREAESGKKKEIKKDDKDLLNIFSRYAAGELPKAALKSFVRQAQLQRKMAKGEETGKMWWNVKYNGQRIEVVADSEEAAKKAAAKEWGGDTPMSNSTIAQMTAEPLRPYTAPPAGSELERIERQAGVGQGVPGLYKIYDTNGRLIAGDEYGSDRAALARAGVWAMRRGVDVVVHNAQGQEIGRVSASGEITPSASSQDEEPLRGGNNTGPYELYNRETGEAIYHIDPDAAVNDGEALAYLQNYRNSSSRPTEVGVRRRTDAPAQQNQGNWGIWISASERFARQPGEYPAGQEVPLRRFSSRDAADAFLAQTRENNPRMRLDVEAREIEPARQPVSDINLFPEIEPTANQLVPHGPGPWELYNTQSGQVFRRLDHTNRAAAETEAQTYYDLYRVTLGDISNYGVRTQQQAQSDAAQGGLIDVAGEQPAPQAGGEFTGQWKVLVNGREVYRFGGVGNSQADANRVGHDWILQQIRNRTLNPADGADVEVLPVMGEA